jgi:Histidine phosphatase superfamily (branch 1)
MTSNSHRNRLLVVGFLSMALMTIGPALARADDESILLDLIRHGESIDNHAGIIDTTPPGTMLDATGEGQAIDIDAAIEQEFATHIAGIFDSDEYRTYETAEPIYNFWFGLYGLELQTLSGLNEIPAGAFEGYPTNSLEGILYLLGPLSWAFGDVLVPDIGDPSVNGVTFDQDFGGAVQDIYDATASATGTSNDFAFSSEGAIAVWTLMNVNNPDFSVVLQTVEQTGALLPNIGQVVIEGSPGDWTLVSYNGVDVPQDPGLGTELFVDFRNLIEAPQFAGYDIYEALLTGNSTTIDAALQTGLNQVDSALSQFPVDVFDQIVTALGGSV